MLRSERVCVFFSFLARTYPLQNEVDLMAKLEQKYEDFKSNLPHSMSGEEGQRELRSLIVNSNKLRKYRQTLELFELANKFKGFPGNLAASMLQVS